MGTWETRSWFVAYICVPKLLQDKLEVCIWSLHLNSCVYELKREVMEVAMELFQTHFLGILLLWSIALLAVKCPCCNAELAPQVAEHHLQHILVSVFSLSLFLLGNWLLHSVSWWLQFTDKFLSTTSICECGNAVCCMWWRRQDVFWHRDWTRCGETFLCSTDHRQGKEDKETPKHRELLGYFERPQPWIFTLRLGIHSSDVRWVFPVKSDKGIIMDGAQVAS